MDDLSRSNWSDPSRVASMVESYKRRYGPQFWNLFEELIGPGRHGRVVEFGCGPGLFLLDMVRRLGATAVWGVDASLEMIGQAREFLESLSLPIAFELISLDLDSRLPDIKTSSIDMVFMGFLIHELKNPESLISFSRKILVNRGLCVVYDYISGDEAAFIEGMVQLGMDAEKARLRYPHMCRNSVDDIIKLLSENGLHLIGHRIIDGFRALVVGVKNDGGLIER